MAVCGQVINLSETALAQNLAFDKHSTNVYEIDLNQK